MTYHNHYGPPGYVPVSKKSGILVVALLTTAAAVLSFGAAFVLPYFEDFGTNYTYFEFINEVEALKTDAMIIGGGLLLAVFCAWLIYAVPKGIGATILRAIFVLAGVSAALIAVLSVFAAGIEDGPSFMDLTNASDDLNWGPGAWIILGASVFAFLLSIVMIPIVRRYRRSARTYGVYGAYGPGVAADPRLNSPYPYQPNTDPHSWDGR